MSGSKPPVQGRKKISSKMKSTPARTGTKALVGAHVSVSGGLERGFDEADRIGADCLQIFVKNQRQWVGKELIEEDVTAFRRRRDAGVPKPVVAHASYLINLACPEKELGAKSESALEDELGRCERLGVEFLVVHPGAHKGTGEEEGLRRIAAALDRIHQRTRGFRSRILLETTAGQGTSLGHRFEHLAAVLEKVEDPTRLGFCLDTCHVFAAGYDLDSEVAYRKTFEDWDRRIGIEKIHCFHLNDSKGERGSRVDRHENIGLGKMGDRPFRNLLQDPRLKRIPKILETPKGTDERGRDLDVVNLKKLRRLAGKVPGSSPRRSGIL